MARRGALLGGRKLMRKTEVIQGVLYFLEAETWVTKRPESGGGPEANKMVDGEARSFSHWPATNFNLRQHRFPFSVAPPAKPQELHGWRCGPRTNILSIQESQMVHTRRVLGRNSLGFAIVVDDDEHPTIVVADFTRRGPLPEGLAFPCQHRSRFFHRR